MAAGRRRSPGTGFVRRFRGRSSVASAMSEFLRSYLTVAIFMARRHRSGGRVAGPRRPPAARSDRCPRSTSRTRAASIRWATAGRRARSATTCSPCSSCCSTSRPCSSSPGPRSSSATPAFGLVEMGVFVVRPAPRPASTPGEGRAAVGVSDGAAVPGGLNGPGREGAAAQAAHHAAQPRAVVLACGCTSGAWPAAPSRWARPSARPATT